MYISIASVQAVYMHIEKIREQAWLGTTEIITV